MKVKSYGDHELWCIIHAKFLNVWFSSFDKSNCFKKLEILTNRGKKKSEVIEFLVSKEKPFHMYF